MVRASERASEDERNAMSVFFSFLVKSQYRLRESHLLQRLSIPLPDGTLANRGSSTAGGPSLAQTRLPSAVVESESVCSSDRLRAVASFFVSFDS